MLPYESHGNLSTYYNILISLPMISLPMIESILDWESLDLLNIKFKTQPKWIMDMKCIQYSSNMGSVKAVTLVWDIRA
jgi:hypothetical protein